MFNKKLICMALACFATSSFAQTYSADYQKLRTNKSNFVWMNDSTVENGEFVNMVLCYVKNTGADLRSLAGAGPYHAQLDQGKCESSSVTDTSQSTATSGAQVKTQSYVVESTLAGDKLDVKLWFPPDLENNDTTAYSVSVRVLLPLSGDSVDIGIDRLDYILHPANPTTLVTNYDPNEAVAYGALVTEKVTGGWRIKQGERILEEWGNTSTRIPGGIFATDADKARSSVMWFNLVKQGSGASAILKGYSQVEEWSNSLSRHVYPAYAVSINDREYLKKSTDLNGSEQCFDRTSSTFSTWAYNLYNQSTGELVKRNSSYRIKYDGKWGNYHQWGAWLGSNVLYQLTFPLNVDIDIGSSSLVAGQLTKRDGKLMRVSSIIKTLGDLKGIPLDFYYNDGNSNQSAQIVWNGVGFEKVAGWVNNRFSPIDPVVAYSFPLATSNWQTIGLWSRSTNGEVKIKGERNNSNTYDYNFSNATTLTSFVRKELKGSDLVALEGKQFNCLNGCPTISGSDISSSYVSLQTDPVKSYKVTGGLLTSMDGQIAYTYPRTVSDNAANAKNFWSGQLVLNEKISSSALKSRYTCSWNTNNVCGHEMWNDSTLEDHYIWSTGEKTWDKSFDLVANGSPLVLEPQLDVEYECPTGRNCAGSKKIVLNYNGPKQLWGIPNKCIDASTLATVDCNSDGNKRWVNLFNLTASPVNASESIDFVTDLTDRNKKYLLLPQGSEEFYGLKSSCSVTLPSETFAESKIEVDDIFNANRAVIGGLPINPNNVLPTVVNGVKIR
jgi:hypothetical protein